MNEKKDPISINLLFGIFMSISKHNENDKSRIDECEKIEGNRIFMKFDVEWVLLLDGANNQHCT